MEDEILGEVDLVQSGLEMDDGQVLELMSNLHTVAVDLHFLVYLVKLAFCGVIAFFLGRYLLRLIKSYLRFKF